MYIVLQLKKGGLTVSKQVVLEFPVDLPEECLKDKKALEKGKEGMVLELLRKGEISQGKATELLCISRHDLLDLIAKHDIPMANFSVEELERQRKEAANKSWWNKKPTK